MIPVTLKCTCLFLHIKTLLSQNGIWEKRQHNSIFIHPRLSAHPLCFRSWSLKSHPAQGISELCLGDLNNHSLIYVLRAVPSLVFKNHIHQVRMLIQTLGCPKVYTDVMEVTSHCHMNGEVQGTSIVAKTQQSAAESAPSKARSN